MNNLHRELDRQTIDDVERGAFDADWQPAKDAARLIAFAEDRAIFDGYDAAGIQGIRQGTSNPVVSLPVNVSDYPEAIAEALSQLRLVGVNGPYAVLFGADAYTALADTSTVRLYLQETLTFLLLTSEASVALAPLETALTT